MAQASLPCRYASDVLGVVVDRLFVIPVADEVQRRVDGGVLPEVFKKLAVQSARPARRVTELMSHMHAGEQAAGKSSEDEHAKYGWTNNLPVVIIPGLCSSGLEVRKSDVKPDWKDERVWFSIEKLGQNRNVVTRMAGEGVKLAAAPVWMVKSIAEAGYNLPQSMQEIFEEGKSVVGGNTLRIHLHRAKELTVADTNGQADPHVRVQILGAGGEVLEEKISETKSETREPFWSEDMDMGTHISMSEIRSVRLIVQDYDGMLANSEYMGEADLALPEDFWTNDEAALPREWHGLVDKKGPANGKGRARAREMSDGVGAALQSITSQSFQQVRLKVSGQVECWAHVSSQVICRWFLSLARALSLSRDVQTCF